MNNDLRDRVCEFVRNAYPEAPDISCGALPDPNEPSGEFRPEIPWISFLVRINLGRKVVELAFESGLWERDATTFDTIRDDLERYSWMDLVARAADRDRIVFHDRGWNLDK